jgi:copper oxidase (laccase) domain-containing protein
VLDAFGVANDRDANAPAAARFRANGSSKWLADLAGLARDRLARVGVRDVSGGGWCTVSDPVRFFSYRRDGVTGRMAAAIWIAGR